MENSEFRPVWLRLKIDLVSYPARAKGLVNMYMLSNTAHIRYEKQSVDLFFIYDNMTVLQFFGQIIFNSIRRNFSPEKGFSNEKLNEYMKKLTSYFKIEWHHKRTNIFSNMNNVFQKAWKKYLNIYNNWELFRMERYEWL